MAAGACLAAAALAVTQPLPDIRPRDTPAIIDLALVSERSGDLAAAETSLLQAAQLDRQYLPAWSLANFYFRHSKPDLFWTWATRAARLTSDPRALLRLANLIASQPHTLIGHLGDRPEILRPYLDLLIAEARFSDAQTVADLLRAHRDPADLPRFDALARSASLRTIRSPGAR